MNIDIKRITFSLVFLLSALSSALAQSVPQLTKKALAATVSLTVQDRNGNTLRRGCGFFIQEGLIATTFHAIEGNVRVSAVLANSETTYRTNVTATDEANNLALLKVREHDITPLDLADSDEVRIGETVYVPQFSLGTVSASTVRDQRNIDTRKGRLRMTDSIWTGNSGAPLLNLEGKVIGMFVSNYDTGDNQISDLAIPSNALKAMLTRPSRGKESVQIGNEKTDSLDSRPTVPQLAKKALAATVSLQMQDENGVIQGRGSGFFVRRNLIATNFHVIDGATKGNMRLVNTKTTYRIDGVTATDESNDLALLKVAVKGVKPLLLGDSDAVEVGETVYAAGNPLGFEGTFSDGIVSGRRDSATKHARLQMTAPISPGSSGGPVLNRDGEVIGVSTSVYNPLFGQNLNFAVPSKALKALLTQSGEAKPLSTRNTSFSHIGYLRRGNEKSLSGDFEGAIREFTQAIRLNPKFVSAYVNRGIAKSDLGNSTPLSRITTLQSALILIMP